MVFATIEEITYSMKKILLPFLSLIFLLALVGCNKLDSQSFYTANERVQGKWTVSKVETKVSRDGKWGKKDVTSNFEGFEFDLDQSGFLSMFTPKENKTYEGYWYMYEDWSWDEDDQEEEVTFRLYMYLEDPDSTDLFKEMTWTNMQVSDSKFKAEEKRTVNGQSVTYYYTLIK
jgi:hypothetical protein